ncbi:hypothetical protein Tco_0708734 [Tanacetum coccineum]
MVIDDDDGEGVKVDNGENLDQLKDPIEENTEARDTIRLADLLASEAIGSWVAVRLLHVMERMHLRSTNDCVNFIFNDNITWSMLVVLAYHSNYLVD